jgi:transcriptional regulator with XRE-family HTH domain
MAGKPQPIIIDPSDFIPFMAARMGALGINVAELAQELGISRAATYALLSGEMKPSEKILTKVGLKIVYLAVPPVRGKK